MKAKRNKNISDETKKKLQFLELFRAETASEKLAEYCLRMFKMSNDPAWLNHYKDHYAMANKFRTEASNMLNK